jgi:hypothetical protein
LRTLRSPYQGFMADHDMIAYYPGWVSSTATIRNETTTLGVLGSNPRHLIAINGSTMPTQVGSLFNPERPLGGWSFAGNGAVATASSTPNDSGYLSNSSVGFTIAFWHRNISAATTVILERSVTPGGTGTSGVLFQLIRQADRRFAAIVRNSSGGLVTFVATSPNTQGFFGLVIEGLSTPTTRALQFYDSFGRPDSNITWASGISSVAATASSARWVIGGSVANVSGGSYASFPSNLLNGEIGEIGMWRRALNSSKMRNLYAGSVQPWDDNVLLQSENYEVRTRVLIADNNNIFQDLTDIDGQDLVQLVERTESVEALGATAKITLLRRLGPLADLSPLNVGGLFPYTNLLALRRRVIIERAITPPNWHHAGWEWQPIFEGSIDSWDVNNESVIVSCSDNSASLKDVFILENRSYNYYNPNKLMEQAQQQVIDDFEPKLRSGLVQPVGYKNIKKPTVFTPAGTTSTPLFENSALMMRYNDVASAPVMEAITTLADQIGFGTGFNYHEPWAEFRLTTYSPARTRRLIHETYQRLSGTTALIEFREPHGLSPGAPLNVAGSTLGSTVNRDYSVASVLDFYRVHAEILPATGTIITSGASFGASSASIAFTYHYELPADSIMEMGNLASNVSEIRNHAIVRFNRNDSVATLSVTNVIVDVSGLISVQVSSPLPNLDPTNQGISFSLEGATGAAAFLNGSYSGYVNQIDTTGVYSDVPLTSYSAGTYTTNLPFFACTHLTYREISSTATSSLQEFGYLPVAVFEGSNLAINTEAEAVRLANNLVSDLASPTANFSVTTKVKPFTLNDCINFPDDTLRGRWTGSATNGSITEITEIYESNNCNAVYNIRLANPTRGVGWAGSIAVGPGRPALAGNYSLDTMAQSNKWNLNENISRSARQYDFFFDPSMARQEMGLRRDQTIVWMSPTPNFIPSPLNKVGTFKSERFSITHEANGQRLSAGTRYYVRFGEMDVFGNVSAISGLGIASAATLPSFIARFADETAGCLAVTTSGVTQGFASGVPWARASLLNIDNGTDAGALSYDSLGLYSTASHFFTAPCDGMYLCNHASSWIGDSTKVPVSATWTMLAGWLHTRGGVTLGLHGVSGVEGTGASVPYRLTATAQISCSSGDRLTLMWRQQSVTEIFNMAEATTGIHYGYVSYALGNQR